MSLRKAAFALLITIAFFRCSSVDTELTNPPSAHQNHVTHDTLLSRLSSYTQAAQQALGSALIKAMQEKGPAGAVTFCNHAALPITDSISADQGVSIHRISDQPRNPANAAQSVDLAFIVRTKEGLLRGERALSQIIEVEGKRYGYAPIITNALCLNCHGTSGNDVAPETLAVIDSLYPNDQAKGYQVNQLRGAWKIEF